MKYKLTEQHARGEEKLIAEFEELNDTKIFMTKKLYQDDEEEKELLYRLYDDSELIHEFNKKNISVAYAQYAEGNYDLNNIVRFFFNVLIKVMNSSERKPIANFNNENDAYSFIISKCDVDETVSDNDLFLILKDKILFDSLSRVIMTHRKKTFTGSNEGNKGPVFQPTPMPMRPVPPGFPSDHWIEEHGED